MVELKATTELNDNHLNQCRNYLEAYNLPVGMLINFGSNSLQYKRIYNTKHPEAKEVLLDTSQHTFGFFEKLGFVTTKITKDGYTLGLNRYDMKLVLEEGSRQHFATLLLGTKGFTNNIVNEQEKDNQHDK